MVNTFKQLRLLRFIIVENLSICTYTINKFPNEDELPPELKQFYNGLNSRIRKDVGMPDKPKWYDERKILIGQEFARKHFFSVTFSKMLCLCLLLSFKHNIKPLIFTRKSDTVEKASNRYMSTIIRVKSWYESDLYDIKSEANKNLLKVRSYHDKTSSKMNGKNITMPELKPTQCYIANISKMDFKWLCPNYVKVESEIFLNQAEMSFTLFGFMGLTILYPEKFGIFNYKEEELEGFVHLWSTIGYILGIEDKYNLCSGSLNKVRTRCKAIVEKICIPNLVNLNEEWEHMARCMVSGVNKHTKGPNLEVILIYLFWVLDLKHDNLLNNMSTFDIFYFHVFKTIYYYGLSLSIIKNLINRKLCKQLEKYEKNKSK